MRSRSTRIAAPVIGLLAVTGALALVATAPVILFSPSNEAGPLPSAPEASREVARVTAPRFHPQRPAGRTASSETAKVPAGPSTGGQLVAPAGGVDGAPTGTVGRRPAGHGTGPSAGEPTEAKHPGKAKGKSKDKGNRKAKGHGKPKHHGKAKGHSKGKGRAL